MGSAGIPWNVLVAVFVSSSIALGVLSCRAFHSHGLPEFLHVRDLESALTNLPLPVPPEMGIGHRHGLEATATSCDAPSQCFRCENQLMTCGSLSYCPKKQKLGAQTELEIPGVNVSARP